MKKSITIIVIIIAAAAFLAAGSTRAEAVDKEAAVALTAGMFLLGIPVMHAIAHEAAIHDRACYHPAPARYIERTKVVYAAPRHERDHRHRDHGWERDRDRYRHMRYEDSHRDSRRHDNNGRRK
ncbi:MAG: hypothetical protein AB1499_03910 [Nitrospirota bacterium]